MITHSQKKQCYITLSLKQYSWSIRNNDIENNYSWNIMFGLESNEVLYTPFRKPLHSTSSSEIKTSLH